MDYKKLANLLYPNVKYTFDEVMEKWSEEHDGDFIDFDFESVCKEACKKHLAAIGNTTITTIYI